MLDDFVIANRDAIITRTKARVASRAFASPSRAELTNGIPVFLDQLAEALRVAKSSDVVDHEQIGKSAGLHGQDLLRMGLSIAQVVHDYGDVCQAITELAVEQKQPIPSEEFRTLNLCLDDAIAQAVTEYALQREREITAQGTERLGILAHELRNLLNTAMLSFESIKSGNVAPGGSTGLLHGRSLMGLRDLIDRSLADVRLDAGIERLEPILVAGFVEEIEIGALIQAQARGHRFTATFGERGLMVQGDRQILAAAISNLLQNAFKFTRKHSHVSLTTLSTDHIVRFEIEDECGGLPPGKLETLFLPFQQKGSDRSGVGLGLSICVKAARANGGEIHVRDLPGKGCVFTLELPRKLPPFSVVGGGKTGTGGAGRANTPAARQSDARTARSGPVANGRDGLGARVARHHSLSSKRE